MSDVATLLDKLETVESLEELEGFAEGLRGRWDPAPDDVWEKVREMRFEFMRAK